MSTHDQVFIAADVPLEAVVNAVAERLPSERVRLRDGAPRLVHGHTAIDFEVHDFEDDESDHHEIHLTRYPYLLTIRDLERDLDRQAAVAIRAFEIAAAHGWPTVVFREMQQLLARYDPPAGGAPVSGPG